MARTDYGAILSTVIKDTSDAVREVNGTSSLIAPNQWGTAIRTMHSDSDYENALEQMIEETASGDIASFSDGANNIPCPSVLCTINPVQSGTGDPSPTNIRTISGWSSVNVVDTPDSDWAELWDIDSSFRGTVAFNQLITAPTDVLSFTTSDGIPKTIQQNMSIVKNHIYLLLAKQSVSLSSAVRNCFVLNDGTGHYPTNYESPNLSNTNRGDLIKATNSTTTGFVSYWCHSPNTDVSYTNFNCIDLTQMFGSTIADYIYSLEQSVLGSGVAFFRNLYPDDYYAYNSGTNELVGGDDKVVTNIPLGSTYYSATLDVTTGVLTVDRAIVDLSNITWFSYDSGSKRWQATITSIYNYPSRNGNLVAEKYVADITANAGDENKMFTVGGAVYIYSTDSTTPPSGNLVYPLATPTTIQLTPTEVKTLLGQNNIFADTGSVSVKYYANGELYVEQHT